MSEDRDVSDEEKAFLSLPDAPEPSTSMSEAQKAFLALPDAPPLAAPAPKPVVTAVPKPVAAPPPAAVAAPKPAAAPKDDYEADLDNYINVTHNVENPSGWDWKPKKGHSAAGGLQFMPDTWAGTAAKHKLDPNDYSEANQRLMGKALTRDTDEHLAARGLDKSYENRYAAHLLGLGGADRVWDADPNAPITSAVSPDVIRANTNPRTGGGPFQNVKTVADFQPALAKWLARGRKGAKPPSAVTNFLALPDAPAAEESMGQTAQRLALENPIARGLSRAAQEFAAGKAALNHTQYDLPEETAPEAKPFEFQWTPDVGSIAGKMGYGLGKSAPTLGAALIGGGLAGGATEVAGGGPENPAADAAAVVTSLIGASAAAGLMSAAQSLGPYYQQEIKAGVDPETAYNNAGRKALEEGAISAAAWGAFQNMPFIKGPIKQFLFQTFVAQPAVAMTGEVAKNVIEGRPVGEGVAETYVPAALGTAAMAPIHAAMGGFRKPLPKLHKEDILHAKEETPQTDSMEKAQEEAERRKKLEYVGEGETPPPEAQPSPVVKPAEPVAPVEEPVVKPDEPVAPPPEPVAKPVEPVAPVEEPVAKPEGPAPPIEWDKIKVPEEPVAPPEAPPPETPAAEELPSITPEEARDLKSKFRALKAERAETESRIREIEAEDKPVPQHDVDWYHTVLSQLSEIKKKLESPVKEGAPKPVEVPPTEVPKTEVPALPKTEVAKVVEPTITHTDKQLAELRKTDPFEATRIDLRQKYGIDMQGATNAQVKKFAKHIAEVMEMVKKIAPHIQARVVGDMTRGQTGVFYKDLVALSLRDGKGGENPDLYGTGRHEAKHAVWRLLTDKEQSILMDFARKRNLIKEYGIDKDEHYKTLPEEDQLKEALATHFEKWRRDPSKVAVDVSAKTYFTRMKALLSRVAEETRKAFGKDITADDLFAQMERGAIGKRASKEVAIREDKAASQRPLLQRASDLSKEGLYSRTRRFVDKLGRDRGETQSAKTWLDALNGRGDFSPDEVKFLGLDDYLMAKAGARKVRDPESLQTHTIWQNPEAPVTASELKASIDNLYANKMAIEVRVLPEEPMSMIARDALEAQFPDLDWARHGPRLNMSKNLVLPKEIKRSNYRDITIGLPNFDMPFNSAESHWGETKSKNVFVHARVSDLEIGGKKYFFLEELQSDVHQQGFSQGYETPEGYKSAKRWVDVYRNAESINDALNGELSAYIKKHGYGATDTKLGNLERRVSKAAKNLAHAKEVLKKRDIDPKLSAFTGKAPEYPFARQWQDIAIRKLSQMIANDGTYDRISWTTGEQQMDRWAPFIGFSERRYADLDINKMRDAKAYSEGKMQGAMEKWRKDDLDLYNMARKMKIALRKRQQQAEKHINQNVNAKYLHEYHKLEYTKSAHYYVDEKDGVFAIKDRLNDKFSKPVESRFPDKGGKQGKEFTPEQKKAAAEKALSDLQKTERYKIKGHYWEDPNQPSSGDNVRGWFGKSRDSKGKVTRGGAGITADQLPMIFGEEVASRLAAMEGQPIKPRKGVNGGPLPSRGEMRLQLMGKGVGADGVRIGGGMLPTYNRTIGQGFRKIFGPLGEKVAVHDPNAGPLKTVNEIRSQLESDIEVERDSDGGYNVRSWEQPDLNEYHGTREDALDAKEHLIKGMIEQFERRADDFISENPHIIARNETGVTEVPELLKNNTIDVKPEAVAKIKEDGFPYLQTAKATDEKAQFAGAPRSPRDDPENGLINRVLSKVIGRSGADTVTDVFRPIQRLAAPMAWKPKEVSTGIYTDWLGDVQNWFGIMRVVDSHVAFDIEHITKKYEKKNFSFFERAYVALEKESLAQIAAGKDPNTGLYNPYRSPADGLASLTAEERVDAININRKNEIAWTAAKNAGLVEGDFIPFYAARKFVEIANNSVYDTAGGGGAHRDWSGRGGNIYNSIMRRKHLTRAESEAAAQQATHRNLQVIPDIRVNIIARGELQRSIAIRGAVEKLMDLQKRTDIFLASHNQPASGSFEINHPAFKQNKLSMKRTADGREELVWTQEPIYFNDDFRGGLEAMLSVNNNMALRRLMELKGKVMSLVMVSPVIHNMVIFGKALPAAPGKMISLQAYRDGNGFRERHPADYDKFLYYGTSPIGKGGQFQMQDDILHMRQAAPGRSITSHVLSAIPDFLNMHATADAVRRGVDKAGDFWHGTLLWDRIHDLQFGLAVHFRDKMLKQGLSEAEAYRTASVMANQFVGSIPIENMGHRFRQAMNFVFFSRSFTFSNLATIKTMITGLPRGQQAAILKSASGLQGLKRANDAAKWKARMALSTDIALYMVSNAALQSAINVMGLNSFAQTAGAGTAGMVTGGLLGAKVGGGVGALVGALGGGLAASLGAGYTTGPYWTGRNDLDKEVEGYVERLKHLQEIYYENPLWALNPFDDLMNLEKLSPTSLNEPRRRDRVYVGNDDKGTGIYLRNPLGKVGEEFLRWPVDTISMFTRKEGTFIKPMLEILNNDKGYGQHIYDPEWHGTLEWINGTRNVLEHLFAAQVPTDMIQGIASTTGLSNAVGYADAPSTEIDRLKAVGPWLGVTFSKGAPGGPQKGFEYYQKDKREFAKGEAMPGIKDQINSGQIGPAMQELVKLGFSPAAARMLIKTTINPRLKANPAAMRAMFHQLRDDPNALWEFQHINQ